MSKRKILSIVLILGFFISTLGLTTYLDQPIVKAQSALVISKLTPDNARLEGGTEIVISGSGFTSDSIIFFGKNVISSPKITNNEIRFSIPPQAFPGNRTITIKNSFGQAQKEFLIKAKSLAELKVGEITTIAGGVPFVGDGNLATKASFVPISIATDKKGNLFISDRVNSRVRQVDSNGVINSIAGTGVRGFGPNDSPAVAASLAATAGIAADSEGNVFITDTSLFRLLKIDAKTGLITSIAGTGTPSFNGDGRLAIDASLRFPISVTVDDNGNIFVIDNTRIREIDGKTGVIQTIAGLGSNSADGISALDARLASPQAILADKQGNLLIADTFSNRIRKIDTTTGIITTIAGNGKDGFSGDGGLATAASLSEPFSIALDEQGNLFIADFGNARVRRVDATGIITTIAGSGKFDFWGDGGLAINAGFSPVSVAIRNGNLLIADFFSKRIRQVDSKGIISTIAGNGFSSLNGDGVLAANSSLSLPINLASDDKGNLFVTETENNRIRRIDSQTGIITTVAGNGINGFSGDGAMAINASLSSPGGIAIDSEKNLLFIADFNNLRVRQVNLTTGVITTVAGNGQIIFAGDGGLATSATLNSPLTVALDKNASLFILDAGNNRVRRVDRNTGVITTFAGRDCPDFNCPLGDGGIATNANLLFLDPDFFFAQGDIQTDNKGNLLIADSFQYRIRQVDASNNIINTIIGDGTPVSKGDGANASQAGFFNLSNLAIDNQGNVFISDSIRIRQVDSSKTIKTIAGGRFGYSGDGALATNASLSSSAGLVVVDGVLYFCDVRNNAIRAIKLSETVKIPMITGASFQKPTFTVNGTNFTTVNIMVKINGQDVSALISNRSVSAISLTGNKKKLNLKKGANSIVVIANGLTSNTFSFTL